MWHVLGEAAGGEEQRALLALACSVVVGGHQPVHTGLSGLFALFLGSAQVSSSI